MSGYDGPFRLPRMTSAAFTKMKRAYVEKHGYTVSVPGFDDVFKLKRFSPLTQEEDRLWRRRQYDSISEPRRGEIFAEKEKKKAMFLQMLGSPSPTLAMNAASIMTAIDNAQDAVSTLACIGLIAWKALPVGVANMIKGPIGWLMIASDCMNLINLFSHLGKSGRAQKRKKDAITEKNPFCTKAKAKRAYRMRKFRPSMANAIEAAQTTEELFGLGLRLGPLMGLANDILFGMVRTKMGEKVTIKMAPGALRSYERVAMDALKSSVTFQAFPYLTGHDGQIDSLIGNNLALQSVFTYCTGWNALDQIDNIDGLEIRAPEPHTALLYDAMTEVVENPEEFCGWPGVNKQWATLEEIQEQTPDYSHQNIETFAQENRHDTTAMIAARSASMFGTNVIAAIEGEEQVDFNYTAEARAVHKILDNGYVYPDDITSGQRRNFELWIGSFNQNDDCPAFYDILRHTKEAFGFSLVLAPDIQRD